MCTGSTPYFPAKTTTDKGGRPLTVLREELTSYQKHVTLSVTEAEQASGVTCAQDMIFVMRSIQSIGLKVKLPMILEMDNKGAVDLANN